MSITIAAITVTTMVRVITEVLVVGGKKGRVLGLQGCGIECSRVWGVQVEVFGARALRFRL